MVRKKKTAAVYVTNRLVLCFANTFASVGKHIDAEFLSAICYTLPLKTVVTSTNNDPFAVALGNEVTTYRTILCTHGLVGFSCPFC